MNTLQIPYLRTNTCTTISGNPRQTESHLHEWMDVNLDRTLNLGLVHGKKMKFYFSLSICMYVCVCVCVCDGTAGIQNFRELCWTDADAVRSQGLQDLWRDNWQCTTLTWTPWGRVKLDCPGLDSRWCNEEVVAEATSHYNKSTFWQKQTYWLEDLWHILF